MPSRETNVDVAGSIAAIAARLEPQVPEITRRLLDRFTTEITELRVDERTGPLLQASVESNVETAFHLLRHGMDLHGLESPWVAGEYARRLAQHDVPLVALIRAYRLGQDSVVQAVLDQVAEAGYDAADTARIARRIVTFSFDFIDLMTRRVTELYEQERDSWLRSRSAARAARVRDLLANRPVDVTAVEAVLGYQLRRRHLGITVWTEDATPPGAELTNLERVVEAIAEHLGCDSRPLAVSYDEAGTWAWLPAPADPDLDADALDRVLDGCEYPTKVALGEVASGVDGFRRTHRQAGQAQAVAVIAADRDARVIRYRDVATVALLCDNMDDTREWVLHVLGPLATDDEQHARLRETYRVFLAAGDSYTAAAAELNLHKNSVKYRVLQAEEIRGRAIRGDRVDVEMALTACRWFGTAVLVDPA